MGAIRLGYVGCGFMAQKVHLPDFSTIPGCELIGLAEVRQTLGQKVQQRFDIPRLYRRHDELLADPDVDAIAVSAGFMVQGQIAQDALQAGKHVFMEKPMAVSLEQADAILDAERGSGRRLMVGYMKRYDCLQRDEPFRSPARDTRTDVRLFEEIFRMYLVQRGGR